MAVDTDDEDDEDDMSFDEVPFVGLWCLLWDCGREWRFGVVVAGELALGG